MSNVSHIGAEQMTAYLPWDTFLSQTSEKRVIEDIIFRNAHIIVIYFQGGWDILPLKDLKNASTVEASLKKAFRT